MPAAFAQSDTASQASANDQPVIKLGKIRAKGEKQIIKLLQTIKVALQQPYSSEPKLANVVVCRITNDIGNHAVKPLSCATNRTHAIRQNLYQIGMLTPIPASKDDGEVRAGVLSDYLMMLPSNKLQAPVNGPALRALLKKIPDPSPSKNQAASDTNTGK
ncbi:MAG: hypothetical protein KGL13_02740 [Gammaproteobacteria bacterium]|nr:hypothetical protein [Gammaproteobacteria bacterium]MDE2345364.1 hypothetical protein [Gammaproteobacteria bacterium]